MYSRGNAGCQGTNISYRESHNCHPFILMPHSFSPMKSGGQLRLLIPKAMVPSLCGEGRCVSEATWAAYSTIQPCLTPTTPPLHAPGGAPPPPRTPPWRPLRRPHQQPPPDPQKFYNTFWCRYSKKPPPLA